MQPPAPERSSDREATGIAAISSWVFYPGVMLPKAYKPLTMKRREFVALLVSASGMPFRSCRTAFL
jgi:hypothetical protein